MLSSAALGTAPAALLCCRGTALCACQRHQSSVLCFDVPDAGPSAFGITALSPEVFKEFLSVLLSDPLSSHVKAPSCHWSLVSVRRSATQRSPALENTALLSMALECHYPVSSPFQALLSLFSELE